MAVDLRGCGWFLGTDGVVAGGCVLSLISIVGADGGATGFGDDGRSFTRVVGTSEGEITVFRGGGSDVRKTTSSPLSVKEVKDRGCSISICSGEISSVSSLDADVKMRSISDEAFVCTSSSSKVD